MSEKPKQLKPSDTHHLIAAEGWLELGDVVSASDELEESHTPRMICSKTFAQVFQNRT
jgi:hypothetical protein